jgi:hypothetical protein
MSVLTKSVARRAARWSAVPAAAALAVVVAAGPALAAGTSVGIYTYGSVHAGRISVTGAYQCPAGSRYADLTVTATQAGPHGRAVTSSVVERLGCTGRVLPWGATLSPRRRGGWFTAGNTRVVAQVWPAGDRRGQAEASLVLNAAAS